MIPETKGDLHEFSTETPARQVAPGAAEAPKLSAAQIEEIRSALDEFEALVRAHRELRIHLETKALRRVDNLRPPRPFSRWRWLLLCCAGLRHRRGEAWSLVRKGHSPRRVSCCTRCGVRRKGAMTP